MPKKFEKNVSVTGIIAYELVALIVPVKKRILFIGSECVKKQFQDFANH